MKKIGIREEDKYVAERRVSITPDHAKRLLEKHQIEVHFKPSKKRIYRDEEFLAAGCKPDESLTDPDIIFGVKEIPINSFEKNKTYIFFSHVIKGQPYNMPMLKKMMEMECNLIDYERVVDENNRRLIFFGRFAGLAGTINSLWSLGLRLKAQGIDTPFLKLKHAVEYHSLKEVQEAITIIGKEIKEKGLPKEICPLVIGITGYGNVSKGAQEITDLLPIQEISPAELLTLKGKEANCKVIYKVVFKEIDMFKKMDGGEFDLQHFFHNPTEYRADFEKFIPSISVLINCIYWDNNFDRIVKKSHLKEHWKEEDFKLTVIGDITCDPDGSIEATHKGTDIEDPIFVYHPETEVPTFGHTGEGILIMAVDILPSELPRDSSYAFADALEPFVAAIANCDYALPFEQLTLPMPIRKAMILHKGKLTPDYLYLEKFVNSI